MNTLLIAMLISQNLFARTYGWTGNDYIYSMIQTQDGGFVLAGTTEAFGAGGDDVLVIRLDPAGNLMWARAYGDTSTDVGYSIVQATDGGFVVAGGTTRYAGPNRNILVLKLEPDGDLSWAKTYGAGATYEEGYSIIRTTDGGYAIGAWGSNLIVLRLDADGNANWARYYYGGPAWVGIGAYSMVQTSDGGYAVTGEIIDYNLDNATPIIRLNPDGSVLWARFFFGVAEGYNSVWDRGNSIIQTSDGGFAVAGITNILLSDVHVFMVIKTDSDGDLSWATVGHDDYATSIVQTPDGGLVTAGQTITLGKNFLIMKMDAGTGDVLWSRTFNVTADDRAQSIIWTTDGGIAVAGNTFTTEERDVVLLRIDGNGDYSGCVVDQVPPIGTPDFTTPDLPISAPVWTHTTTNPAFVTTASTPTVTNICEPLYEEENENSDQRPGVFCVSYPKALLFSAPWDTPIRIYSPDGRMAYLGQLTEGQTHIPLDQGIYFWQAGPYKGKAVVR